MADITGNQTVRIRMPVATATEIDAAKKEGVFAFDTTAGTAAVCPADGANFVRLGLHPADAPAATSLGGTDLVLIVQGGVLKRTTVADISGGGVWQPLDSDLTAIAALTTTAFGRSFLTLANGPAALAAIGAASASDLAGYQPLDSDLTAIAALTTTSFGRSLLAMVDGPAVRAAIGAGTVVPGDLASYQPLDSDLTAIASLTTDAFGRGLLPLASAAAVRSYIGAGTSSFSGAYASLSSIPASIDAIDGLTPAADRIPYYTGASTGALATLTAFARTLLDDQDAATFRDTVSVPPVLSLSGTVDAKAINSGKAGMYRLAASTYANFWTGITAGQQASVLQLESPTGLRTLIASDNKAGGLLTRFRASDFPGDGWSDWYTLWDSGTLPVGSMGRSVLATTTQAGARAAIAAAAADHNHAGVYAPVPAQTSKSGTWTLDANTPTGILQTTTGTLTLPAASATYASKSYIVTASTSLTLTIAGTFCYLDATNSVSYWYTTETSQAFAMNGGHASGVRKKVEIWCDGQEWLVKC